jgi:hypothetical protein
LRGAAFRRFGRVVKGPAFNDTAMPTPGRMFAPNAWCEQ